MIRASEIVKEITEILLDMAEGEYDNLLLEVEVSAEGRSIDLYVSQSLHGKIEEPDFQGMLGHDVMMLSFDLHEALKEHTGGDLHKYTIRIDETGKATANFEYDDPQPENAN